MINNYNCLGHCGAVMIRLCLALAKIVSGQADAMVTAGWGRRLYNKELEVKNI